MLFDIGVCDEKKSQVLFCSVCHESSGFIILFDNIEHSQGTPWRRNKTIASILTKPAYSASASVRLSLFLDIYLILLYCELSLPRPAYNLH